MIRTVLLIASLMTPALAQVEWSTLRFFPPPPPPQNGQRFVYPTEALQGRIRDEALLGYSLPANQALPAFQLLKDNLDNFDSKWALRLSYQPGDSIGPEKFYLIREKETNEIQITFLILNKTSMFIQTSSLLRKKHKISYSDLNAIHGIVKESDKPELKAFVEKIKKIDLPSMETELQNAAFYGFWQIEFVSRYGVKYTISMPEYKATQPLLTWLQELSNLIDTHTCSLTNRSTRTLPLRVTFPAKPTDFSSPTTAPLR